MSISNEIIKLKCRLDALLEDESVDSEKVLRLSEEIDQLISAWYKVKDVN